MAEKEKKYNRHQAFIDSFNEMRKKSKSFSYDDLAEKLEDKFIAKNKKEKRNVGRAKSTIRTGLEYAALMGIKSEVKTVKTINIIEE